MKKKRQTIDAVNAEPGLGNWLIRLVKGLLIGIGGILPGLSGGVLTVIFGLYQPAIRFLSHLKQDFMANLRYFIPVGIGGLLGIFTFSLLVEKAFGRLQAEFVLLFLGFVIGTLPALYRTAGKKGRKWSDFILLLVMAALVFSLMFVGKDLPQIQATPLVWFFAGALVSFGFLLPGMSPSNFLIYLGLYDKMAQGIHQLDPTMIFPFLAGIILTVLLFSKLVNWLFDRYYAKMYHAIIGMVLGSTLGVIPAVIIPAFSPAGLAAMGMSFLPALLLGLAMLVVGTLISYQFSKLESRVEEENPDYGQEGLL